MKILVIDNNENIRQDLKVALENEGYEVLTAEAGREGLEIFTRELPSQGTSVHNPGRRQLG
ncbi:MAG: hypothetical protein P8X67_04710 [Syntrophobacterales bacterium]